MRYLALLVLLLLNETSAALPILRGASAPEQAVLSVLATKDDLLTFALRAPKSESIKPSNIASQQRDHSPAKIWTIKFDKIDPLKPYDFIVNGGNGKTLDKRQLLPFSAKATSLRFALVSCMDDKFADLQLKMWPQMLKQKPEMIFMAGDNVYADRGVPGEADPATLWNRYVETRSALAVFDAPVLVPVVATWDDHDYGTQNGGGDYKHKIAAKEIFDAFFPRFYHPKSLVEGPGVATALYTRGQSFFFMDDRSYKTTEQIAANKSKHWGDQQIDWLKKQLTTHKRPTWLINGVQFFGAYHQWESYERQAPQEFKSVFAMLKALSAPVILASGDRHLFEVMRIEPEQLGYETIEVTSSSIHAKVYPEAWSQTPNPRQIAGVANTNNYALINSKIVGKQVEVQVQGMGPDAKVLFDRTFKIP